MPLLNPHSRELVVKIVYYGPGLGGKTTSLEVLHKITPATERGKLVSLATPVDRTLYFDFLPVRDPRLERLTSLEGQSIRLQLFTVPGQVHFNATRKLVLTGADGIVFVADSQVQRLDANVESVENLRENLAEQGRDLDSIPLSFQFNKRDLPEIVSIEELNALLNPGDLPAFPTIARDGEGVREALDSVISSVLRALGAREPLAARPSLPHLPGPLTNGRANGVEAPQGNLSQAISRVVDGQPVLELHDEDSTDGDLRTLIPPDVDDGSAERVTSFASSPPPPAPASSRGVSHSGGLASALSDVLPPMPPVPPPASSQVHTLSTLSFAALWPEVEREGIQAVEDSLRGGRPSEAIERCDGIVLRMFSAVASLMGSVEAPRDPSIVALLVGIDGRRYLAFRERVQRVRRHEMVALRDALEAYTFVLELRAASSAFRSRG